MSMFDKFTKEDFLNVLEVNDTWSGVLKSLDVYDKHLKELPYLKQKLTELCIDYSNFGKSIFRRKPGTSRNQFTKYSHDEIFKFPCEVNPSTVKRALLEVEDIKYECAICGMEPVWQGKPLVLTMDHIDGNTDNCLLENLRWVCPNCDRQLLTFCGRNKKRTYTRERKYIVSEVNPDSNLKAKVVYKKKCPECGALIWHTSDLCEACSRLKSRKVERPDRDVLKEDIREIPFITLAKKYGVSDNAIRKWCKAYNLPYKSSEIRQMSDDEWEVI